LSQATIVVRVSPTLEQFITPLLNPDTQTIITLADSPALTFLPMPEKHQHTHHESHQEHGKHEIEHGITTSQDPHFWLDPNNAIKIAQYLTAELTKIDPIHTILYQKNSQKLIDDIKKTDQHIRLLLQNDQHKPYLTFHASFQYFSKYYALETPQIISLYEDLPLGIKTIRHLRQLIKKTKIRCLVSQPTANKALTQVLTEGFSIHIILLDPVGSTLPKTHNHYTDLLYQIAEKLHNCMTHIKK
jgi:zinc transport system substrate-binding protein